MGLTWPRTGPCFRVDHLSSLNVEGSCVCYGMPAGTSLLVKYKSDKTDLLRFNFAVSTVAVLSWRFSDHVLRVKPLQFDEDAAWVNLIDLEGLEVAQLVFSPSNDLMYVGFTSGLVRVYSLVLNPNTVSAGWGDGDGPCRRCGSVDRRASCSA